MAETAADLVDNILPRVPVRQWVLSFPIPLRSLFAVHPALLTPVLKIIHRAINTFLIQQTKINRSVANTGAITLIQRFGSAANLNTHLPHWCWMGFTKPQQKTARRNSSKPRHPPAHNCKPCSTTSSAD